MDVISLRSMPSPGIAATLRRRVHENAGLDPVDTVAGVVRGVQIAREPTLP